DKRLVHATHDEVMEAALFYLTVKGKKLCTIVDTSTQWEPHSMLAATFSGRFTVCKGKELKGNGGVISFG
ncbi:hypothetical protein Tco_1167434, partial [Tanacetum coccineum]